MSKIYQIASHLITFCVTISLVLTCQAGIAAEFDIPLAELNKVKKKYPARSETKKRRNVSKKQEKPVAIESGTASENPDAGAKDKSSPQMPGETAQAPELTSEKAPVPVREQQEAAVAGTTATNILISHTPYSYLMAGRRTVIQAVISSNTQIAKVYCYFHATGISTGAAVYMTNVSGTRFTYTCTVPALSPDSRGLSYRIFVIDSSGTATQSPSYEIPRASASVFPGWQPDNFNDPLDITIDDNRTVLEGFSDPSLKRP